MAPPAPLKDFLAMFNTPAIEKAFPGETPQENAVNAMSLLRMHDVEAAS
jgi:hypothetical protein